MIFKQPKNKTFIVDYFIKKVDGEWWICGKDSQSNFYKMSDRRYDYKTAKRDMLMCRRSYLGEINSSICWLEAGTKYIMFKHTGDTLTSTWPAWHIVYKTV